MTGAGPDTGTRNNGSSPASGGSDAGDARSEAGRDEPREELHRAVRRKEIRKLEARRRGERSAWFGLGMFGLVGWSIALPTLVGIGLGVWLDARYPRSFSWTLTLMFGGLVLGCLNAWRWVEQERRGGES